MITFIFTIFVPYHMIRYQYDFSNAFDRVLFYPLENTEWAADFSEENFSKIRVGMTKKEVLAIIGKPLIETGNTASYWAYWAYTRYKNDHDDSVDRRMIYFDIHDTVDRVERSFM